MGKGRDIDLIALRDAALCRRYIYWSEVQRLRPDDVLKILSRLEFFISEETILKIIRRAARLGTLTATPAPKAKRPHLTYQQLQLFGSDPDFNLEQIRRDSRSEN